MLNDRIHAAVVGRVPQRAVRAVGGLGRDRMIGAGGNDTFYARDGRQDRIDGGPGRDRAFVDRLDHLRRVERVIR